MKRNTVNWKNSALLTEPAYTLFQTKGEQGYHTSIQRLADILENEAGKQYDSVIDQFREIYFAFEKEDAGMEFDNAQRIKPVNLLCRKMCEMV